MSTLTSNKYRFSGKTLLVFDAVVVVIGVVSLIGWQTGRIILTRGVEPLPPMHYLAAVCFILSGIGLLLSGLRAHKFSVIVAIPLLFIGVFDLIENFFGCPFDCAAVFGLQSEYRSHFHNTTIGAVAFTFIALGLIVRSRRHKFGALITGSFGAFALACGIGTLIGFATGLADSMEWGHISEVSMPGAFAFLLLGSSIVLQTRRESLMEKLPLSHYVPVTILIVGLTVSFCVRQIFHSNEDASINATVESELQNVKHLVEKEINRRVLANERMAERWAESGGIEKEIWEKDALRYFKDYGSYQAIEWVDRDNIVQWVVPLEQNKQAVGFDLSREKTRLSALVRAKETRKSTITRAVKLIQGGNGILAYTPIYSDTESMGFIVGVFRIEKLLNFTIPESIRNNYSVTFLDGINEVYTSTNSANNDEAVSGQSDQIVLAGTAFGLRISPYKKRIDELSSPYDDLALLLGTLLSLFLSGAVFSAQRSRRHNAITAKANQLLKSEIEARKLAEKMHRETSTFREAILNGANRMIISTDQNGKVTSFNRTAEYLLGYSADEVVGKCTLDQFHKVEEIEEYTEELRRRLSYDITPGFEALVVRSRDNIADERDWTYVCKNNSTFPVALSVTAIFDEIRQITGYLAIGRDNSQLHNTSRRLIESEEKFQAFVNNIPVLAFIKDNKGKYRFVNNNFEKMFSLKPGEIIGKTAFDLVDEATATSAQQSERRILKTGLPEECIELISFPDHDPVHFLIVRFIVPSIQGEDTIGVIAFDLSAQKAVEEELRSASYAAVESSRLKSEFLANMSHEIRTPMNGVLGMLDVLLETQLNASQREYAEVIQDSAKSLLNILNDILDFSKLEAGKLVFEAIDFDLRTTVENTLALFSEQADSKGVEIISVIEPDVPTSLVGDPGRVRQVLTNLIGNAVKFTSAGEVVVLVSKVVVDAAEVTLRFEVSDTGIGISKDAQSQLFDAFVQADGSMVRKYGGTGLGLSISKQIVELMKGKIAVESNLGEGTTFSFEVGFGLYESKRTKGPSVDLSGLKVLIVDDRPANRKNIAYQLQNLGMVVTESSNGVECMSELMSHASSRDPFDIVMLDYHMPDINGFETAEMIRSNPEFEDVRIVIMPTLEYRGDTNAAMRSGVSAYLIKPIRQNELFDCLTNLMSGNSRAGAGLTSGEEKYGLINRQSLFDTRGENSPPILVIAKPATNQSVISMQLELLGYRCELVSRGYEAVGVLELRTYSLILIDVDLPEMEAFVTVDKVRNVLGNKTIPIIGITPDHSDRQKQVALASGMNTYLKVPLSEEQLSKTIDDLLTFGCPAEVVDDSRPAGETPGTSYEIDKSIELNLGTLAAEFGEDVVEMTISLFAEDSARHLTDINDAINEEDFQRVAVLARSLKLTCETVSASLMQDLCNLLESKAEKQKQKDVLKVSGELSAAFESVLIQFEQLQLGVVGHNR